MNIKTDSWHFRFINWVDKSILKRYYWYPSRWHYFDDETYQSAKVNAGYSINLCQYMNAFILATLQFVLWLFFVTVFSGVIGTFIYYEPTTMLIIMGIIVATAGLIWMVEHGPRKLGTAISNFEISLAYPEEGSFLHIVKEYRQSVKDKFCVSVTIVDGSDSHLNDLRKMTEILEERDY